MPNFNGKEHSKVVEQQYKMLYPPICLDLLYEPQVKISISCISLHSEIL